MKYLFIALALLMTSCSLTIGSKGKNGTPGKPGENAIQTQNGKKGTNGTNGHSKSATLGIKS